MTKSFNRVYQSTATIGTGSLALGAASAANALTLAQAGAVDGDLINYIIEDGADFEIGLGTVSASGATLARTTVELSKAGATIGTSKLTLSGAARVRSIESSKFFNNSVLTVLSSINALLDVDTVTSPPSPGDTLAWTGTKWAPGASGGAATDVAHGRLTLESGVPISTTDQLAKGTLYWTPYRGNTIGLYTGAAWVLRTFTERSLSLAGLVSGSVYDVFAYDVAGVVTLEALVWASTTARATALAMQDGILVKSGDATRRFLGSMVMSATGQTQVKFGGSGPGGVSSYFGISNYYNKVDGIGVSIDTTGNWTYATNVIRPANNSTSNRTTFVTEVSEDAVEAKYSVLADGSAVMKAGVAINSTTNSDASAEMYGSGTSLQGTLQPTIKFRPAIGVNYVQAVENSPQATTITFYAGSAYFRFETKVRY